MDSVCTIEIINDLPDDAPAGEVDDHAMIQIEFKCGEFSYTFLITEPTVIRRSAWNQLLHQEQGRITFHRGNCGGSIDKQDGVYTFSMAIRTGEDIVSNFKAPTSVFDPILADFLYHAYPYLFCPE
jgi:hypothetical protein